MKAKQNKSRDIRYVALSATWTHQTRLDQHQILRKTIDFGFKGKLDVLEGVTQYFYKLKEN